MYSPSIEKLITALKRLPSVGQHTAERYVFHLLKSGKREPGELLLALKNLIEKTKSCVLCGNYSDTSPCPICNESKRDHMTICVVADPPNLTSIERTGAYHGVYHVLRGLLDFSDDTSIAQLTIGRLMERIKKQKIKEVILAMNPDLPGETTMLYLEKEITITFPSIKISRLARGLPMGADLNYADEITLSNALKNRTTKNPR